MPKMNMFNKILYLGAGLHTEVINHFPKTSSFVFVDSCPKNEYGFDYYRREFYRENFISELYEKLHTQYFTKYDEVTFTDKYSEINRDNLESSCIYFYDKSGKNLRSEKNLKYFISTSIPNDLYDNKYLQKEIESCDTLIMSGHHPHKYFINFMKTPINVVMYGSTYFPKDLKSYIENDRDDANTIVAHMFKYPEIVKSYTFVNPDTGDSKSFETYNEFYDCLQEYREAENEKENLGENEKRECRCKGKYNKRKQGKKLRFNLCFF